MDSVAIAFRDLSITENPQLRQRQHFQWMVRFEPSIEYQSMPRTEQGKPMAVKPSVSDLTQDEVNELWMRILLGSSKKSRHHPHALPGIKRKPNRREPSNESLTCWKSAYANKHGSVYPRIRYRGKNLLVHHIAYRSTGKPLPETINKNAVISHDCSNRWCCRPEHLSIMPQSKNFEKVNCLGGQYCGHDPKCLL